MFWTDFRRVFKAGFVNFWRNGIVSFSSVFVMVITLFVLGSIIFSSALLTSSLEEIKMRVDINAYFIASADEEDVLAAKNKLEAMPEVVAVEYVSREKVLENFRTRHENDEVMLQALNELQGNPFGPILNIRAKETSQYEAIARFFDSESLISRDNTPIVESVNYFENQKAIEGLDRLIEGGRKIGAGLTLILVLLSITITLNTVRLAIYIAKDEIAVMKLVGASRKYIRGPFVVIGLMYGVIAGVITLILFYPATYWLASVTEKFFGGLNVLHYYASNFLQIFALIMVSGMILGAISSYLAIRKYLKG